ncbi:hypothetical protein EBI_25827 [Enterocytozoon bieneusi H348]|nr:hypothetical protein EBI_25827 [Enterocytozoon bieneusi H348]|eukprot:XP_002650161.1 hypothetical protein EBI_25827 [Enterocytozoon bieneusi H348]
MKKIYKPFHRYIENISKFKNKIIEFNKNAILIKHENGIENLDQFWIQGEKFLDNSKFNDELKSLCFWDENIDNEQNQLPKTLEKSISQNNNIQLNNYSDNDINSNQNCEYADFNNIINDYSLNTIENYADFKMKSNDFVNDVFLKTKTIPKANINLCKKDSHKNQLYKSKQKKIVNNQQTIKVKTKNTKLFINETNIIKNNTIYKNENNIITSLLNSKTKYKIDALIHKYIQTTKLKQNEFISIKNSKTKEIYILTLNMAAYTHKTQITTTCVFFITKGKIKITINDEIFYYKKNDNFVLQKHDQYTIQCLSFHGTIINIICLKNIK